MRKKQGKLLKIILYLGIVVCTFAFVANMFAMMKYLNEHGSLLPKQGAPPPAIVIQPSDVMPPASLPDAWNLLIQPGDPLIPDPPADPIGDVAIAGFKTLKIPANTKDISVDFYNPSSNEGKFMMTFELLFPMPDGTRLSLYSSGLLEAGNHIRNISLDYPIPQGIYENCILRVQPYFISDHTPGNTADVTFTLTAA
jgi:hypothetical protein